MSELMNPRVPGLGLAPALESRDMQSNQRAVRTLDMFLADRSAKRPVMAAATVGAASAIVRLPRRVSGVSGVGANRAAATSIADCRPGQPAPQV
jgi:hypothetical protein